jgi:nucleoside-diphosphate-sugar epimerase
MGKRNVLVTGGSGFLGRQIVTSLLSLGCEPTLLQSPRQDLLSPGGPQRVVAAARADTLIHAAWITRHGDYWDSEENIAWVTSSLELVRAFAAVGGKRVVFVGSCAEYDWTRPTDIPWRETRALRPTSLYGAAKFATWTVIAAFAAQAGLSAACARVFMPVGRYEAPERLLPSLIASVISGAEVRVGPADQTRDVMDVRDAGEAIARLALTDSQGPANIGTGQPVMLSDLVKMVVGSRRHAITLGGRSLRRGEPLWMVADPSRLQRATGFVPRYTLADTIADAFAYWREVRVPTG